MPVKVNPMNIKTYSELITFSTFEERFRYLKLDGRVGEKTFGFDRYINQAFYKSDIWKQTRRDVILRDMGNDLGIKGYDIIGTILVHHMNPISLDNIMLDLDFVINKDYLITTCLNTHNAIHYSDKSPNKIIERVQGDTCPWKK